LQFSTAQQPPAPASAQPPESQPTPPTTVATTAPHSSAHAEVEAVRAARRKMQAEAAVVAGYPLIGTQVEVRLADAATTPVPRSHDPNRGVSNNDFVLVGKLVAFDVHWVAIEAEDASRVWVPREHVAMVYEPPAGVGGRRPRQAPGAR
jgi:hypothetical protein